MEKNIFNQMKTAKEKVMWLLRNHPSLRDSDSKLLATFWHNEMNKMTSSVNGLEVLGKIAKGELTKPESIRRVRQKIQEENPELRGEVWLEKKLISEQIRLQIKDL
jgi:hypothetical protein